MYEGHQFIRLCDGAWVFDLTEYIGYKVKVDKKTGEVKEYSIAFTALNYDKQIVFEKHTRVPAKVLRETINIIIEYEKEALINQ